MKSDSLDNSFVEVVFKNGSMFELHMETEHAKHIARRLTVESTTVIEVEGWIIKGNKDADGMVCSGLTHRRFIYVASGEVAGVMITECPVVKYSVE